MRFIIIPGIFDAEWKTKYTWHGWARDLKRAFPDAEVVLLRDFYLWWQDDKMEHILDAGCKLLNDGTPTVIVAHSFGGILAKALIARCPDAQVRILVTLATPHTFDIYGILETKEQINAPDLVSVPTRTYGGYLDAVVPYEHTSMGEAPHTNLHVTHIAFYASRFTRRRIIKDIEEELKTS